MRLDFEGTAVGGTENKYVSNNWTDIKKGHPKKSGGLLKMNWTKKSKSWKNGERYWRQNEQRGMLKLLYFYTISTINNARSVEFL